MNFRRWRSLLISITLLLLAFTALIFMGALFARMRFLTRGIPDGLPDPIPNGGVRLGVNTYLEKYDSEQLEQSLKDIERLGFSAIKQSFYFSHNYNWAVSDEIVQKVVDAGFILVPVLDGDPIDDFTPPEDPLQFAQWARAFAERYGEFIDHYFIWDEPNLAEHWGGQNVNPAEYAALLSAAATNIRAVDPEAVIITAPLAPTVETGPRNISDHQYLQALYESGAGDAFDVVGGKPYGFNSGPEDRTIEPATLNFSRLILLREVMELNSDGDKAIWAGNWGWNSLPDDWQGAPSIWGQVDESMRARWSEEAVKRARREWPWMGFMFVENWEPNAPKSDPRWGFSIAESDTADLLAQFNQVERLAYPGFYLADPDNPSQVFEGEWRFSPEYGADVGNSGDTASFRFWGTDIGLRVRRADYHGRFYVTIDGDPANALPNDENGPALVLNSPDPEEDYVTNELVATGLPPGEHEVVIRAHRGTDQWALNGFTAAYQPQSKGFVITVIGLGILTVLLFGAGAWVGRHADWGGLGLMVQQTYDSLDQRIQLGLTSIMALLVSLAGWTTWGEQAAGIYRRLGDGGQLALTAAAASTFYIAPSLILYSLAFIILFILVYLRPAWGLAITVFSFPFYVNPKPMLGYQFSPVELFLVVTTSAIILRWMAAKISSKPTNRFINQDINLISADYAVLFFALVATLSLIFTERLDVATNEWRVVIIEPIILYFLLRIMIVRDKEMWTMLDSLILGAVVMSLIGLWQYATGQNLITSEGGLMRLRSIYGSPNNVALYLGRIIPILVAYVLMGKGRRRSLYGLGLVVTTIALSLTFSKGSLFLGLPLSLLVILVYWRRARGGNLWLWLVGFFTMAVVIFLGVFQIPQTAGRLNPQGITGFLRLNLWKASFNMFRDHPIFGVGLDNFLYEYRGKYLLDAAWKEPNLSHPHNLILDLATRLGIFGLVSGIWLIWSYWSISYRLPNTSTPHWKPIAVGLVAVLFGLIAHGLVDHTIFLVDLSFVFFFLFGLCVWIKNFGTKSVTQPVVEG